MNVGAESVADPSRPAWSRPVAAFVLSASLLLATAAVLFVALRGPAPSRSLPDRVRAVASTLRCPVCQNLSVADSPSGIAQQMREAIRTELEAGQSPDQIRAGFVRSYGEWILLSPPRHGLELAVWIIPGLLMLGGLAVGAVAVRRWTLGRDAQAKPPLQAAGALSTSDRRLLERARSSWSEEGPL